MKTKQFARFLKRLEETNLRNKITEILAELFSKVSVKEIDKVCYLVLGQLAPLHQSVDFNIAEKSMINIIAATYNRPKDEIIRMFKQKGDLGDLAFDLGSKKTAKDISISQLYTRLVEIANQEGIGSQERKLNLFSSLLLDLNPLAQKYIIRMPVGKLRLGFSNLTILDALSFMNTGDKSLRPALERAYNVSTDIGLVAKIFKQKGESGLKKIEPIIGIPIKPALTSRLGSIEDILKKLGGFALEPKYDGFRVQIHLDKKKKEKIKDSDLFNNNNKERAFIRFFSRQLNDTTHMFPDLISQVESLPVTSAIFDGEAIGFDQKTGNFLQFQETVQRRRKYQIEETAKKIPLKVFVFDLLYLNGKSTMNLAFSQRRKKLEEIFKKTNKDSLVSLTPQDIVTTKAQIEKKFYQYILQGLEGIICKKLASKYKAGARDFTWVKYKRTMKSHLVDTLDCLILGYYAGKGKRSDFGIGAFLVGIRDKTDNFKTIAKIGTGLSDELWKEVKTKADKIKTDKKPKEYSVPKELTPDVWLAPGLVVEIKADELSQSPLHSSGYALRFPRMERFRKKQPNEITSLKEVKNLYTMQIKQ